MSGLLPGYRAHTTHTVLFRQSVFLLYPDEPCRQFTCHLSTREVINLPSPWEKGWRCKGGQLLTVRRWEGRPRGGGSWPAQTSLCEREWVSLTFSLPGVSVGLKSAARPWGQREWAQQGAGFPWRGEWQWPLNHQLPPQPQRGWPRERPGGPTLLPQIRFVETLVSWPFLSQRNMRRVFLCPEDFIIKMM